MSTTVAQGTHIYIQTGWGGSGEGVFMGGGNLTGVRRLCMANDDLRWSTVAGHPSTDGVGHKAGERGFETERYGTMHSGAALTGEGSRRQRKRGSHRWGVSGSNT
jgi:hypothetical protein